MTSKSEGHDADMFGPSRLLGGIGHSPCSYDIIFILIQKAAVQTSDSHELHTGKHIAIVNNVNNKDSIFQLGLYTNI